MNAIINFGNPRKEMQQIADVVLGSYSSDHLKITGIEIYQQNNLILTSAAYGAGMTLDALQEMKINGLLEARDAIVFVGSMGSLCEDQVSLEDIVIPNPCACAYYGFAGTWLSQDEYLLGSLKNSLDEDRISYHAYRHGSSFAVFDPHTDHGTYTSSLYGTDVVGVDCGEVFLGLHFAHVNELHAAAVLYCSDSPRTHVTDIGAEEFNKRAIETDVSLNKLAARVLRLHSDASDKSGSPSVKDPRSSEPVR